MECLLCSAESVTHEVSFWKCLKCELIFKDPVVFPEFRAEKARYETHNNDVLDPGYLKYLDKLFSLVEISSGSILDYGCGPSKGLAALVDSKQLTKVKVDSYDPIFFPEISKTQKYDLVFASECVEHFFEPQKEFLSMFNMLKPGGLLAVSTELHDNRSVSDWWYANDPTHVIFFGIKTFEAVARDFGLDMIMHKNPHLLLKKPDFHGG